MTFPLTFFCLPFTLIGVMSEMSQSQMFSCSVCSLVYTSQMDLTNHIKSNHDNLRVTMLSSGEIKPQPSSSSQSPVITPAHTQKQVDKDNPRPYSCEQCEKKFTRKDYLKTHQRVHTGERPYHCEQCGKNFAETQSLKRHQQIHVQ